MAIHIIDVDQGDCILIQTPEQKNILIDGGEEDKYYLVKNYLKKNHVKTLDKVISTHPHSDHIGGLSKVIKDFKIISVFSTEKSENSNEYYNFIESCREKNLKINHIKKGDKLNIDNSIKATVISPSKIVENTNECSIVIYMKYFDETFLFTGDAEKENETEILHNYDISHVNFLKVAHHGSNSSSSDEFISKIKPDVSAISCGYKNKYGHPHKETLTTLRKYHSKIYRTDIVGNIVFYSDGHKIFTKKKYKHD